MVYGNLIQHHGGARVKKMTVKNVLREYFSANEIFEEDKLIFLFK